MNIEDLSPELKEKVGSCRTVEELRELLEEEGTEIPDAELDAIAAGTWLYNCPDQCHGYIAPNCKK